MNRQNEEMCFELFLSCFDAVDSKRLKDTRFKRGVRGKGYAIRASNWRKTRNVKVDTIGRNGNEQE